MKRWLCVLLALLTLCVGFAVQAEDRKTEYVGGVVLRTLPKTDHRPSDEHVNVGYMECSRAYLLLNHMSTWRLGVEGGQAPYDIEAVLWRRPFDAEDEYYWYYDSVSLGDKREFNYVFRDPGYYFWEITVTDSAGQVMVFQNRPMKTAAEDEEADDQTLAGKVNQIIAQEITAGMSEYQRALVLHDWLIYNANYDYTLPLWYEPEGVLLYGSGVCDSYARAYQMLCTAAGLECICVTGFGNGGSHGWNLVKVDGSWYHVDCTWDDPGTGGNERHDYFLLTDEEIGRDHDWNFEGTGDMMVPDAEDTDFTAGTPDCDFTFTTTAECTQAIRSLIAAGDFRQTIVGVYTGDQNIKTVYNTFGVWAQMELPGILGSNGWWTRLSVAGSRFQIEIQWKNPVEYVRINEEKAFVTVGETVIISAADYYPAADAFTWTSSDPAVATVTAAYDEADGLTMHVKGVGVGTAVITVTSKDGLSDSMKVAVMPAFTPDLHVEEEITADGIHLTWASVPGVTEYHVHMMSVGQAQEECVIVVTEHEVYLTQEQLPASVKHEVWIVGRRVIGGQIVAEYCGEHKNHEGHSVPRPHTPVTDAAVAPTCTEIGLTEGSHCAVCEEVLEAREIIPALGHAEMVEAGIPATHVTTGLTDRVSCSRCGIVLQEPEVIPIVQTAVFSVPGMVQTIEAEAFTGCRFECVVIGSGCQRIGASAFADNAELRFVEIPASVTSIDATAFAGCSRELIIVATAGSAAEAFALANGMVCILR